MSDVVRATPTSTCSASGGRNPVNLTADSPEADTAPAFSPDGERIAFRSERDGGGHLRDGLDRRVGEAPHRLRLRPRLVARRQADRLLGRATARTPTAATAIAHLWLVPSSGRARSGSSRSEGDAVQPRWSPGGRRIAFWGLQHGSGQRDIWTIPADATGEPVARRGHERPGDGLEPRLVARRPHLYFASERGGSMNLWRVAIDEASGRTRGEPEPVTTPSRTSGSISFSRDGQLMMFVSSDRRSTHPARSASTPPRAAWPSRRARSSRARASSTRRTSRRTASGSPSRTLGGREDLFVVKSDGTGYRQLTDDAFRDRGPRWSPDGTRIALLQRPQRALRDLGDPPRRQRARAAHEDHRAPRERRSPGRPTESSIATDDGAQTWIEDLTQPLDQRQAEALPPLEGGHALQPRSWSPDGTTLAGDLDLLRVARTASRCSTRSPRAATARCPRAGARPLWLSDSRRLLVARTTGSCLLDTRTGRATPVLAVGRAGDQPLARRPLGELHRDPRPRPTSGWRRSSPELHSERGPAAAGRRSQ